MHIGYALIVAASLFLHGRRRFSVALQRLPAVRAAVVVATSNHFFFDAAAGALSVALW